MDRNAILPKRVRLQDQDPITDIISKTKYYYQPDKKNVGIPHKEKFTYILNNTSFNKYTSNTSHWQERHTVKMKSKRERL